MGDNTPVKVVVVWLCHYMMNLHFILCKVNANSNKLFLLLEAHSSFRFKYRLLTMTTFFEIAVYTNFGFAETIHRVAIRRLQTRY